MNSVARPTLRRFLKRFFSAISVLAIPFSVAAVSLNVVDIALSEYEDVRKDVLAGVRSVGNGGGYAEMQAEFINLRLKTWITNAPPAVTIEIEPSCAATPIQVMSSSLVRLASCALYSVSSRASTRVSGAQPKQFNEIATWVLTARWMAQGLDFKAAYGQAAQQFSGFTQAEESLEISLTGGNFLFHDLSVQMNGNSNKVLSLEGRNRAHDITGLALNEIRCGTHEITSWDTRDSYARASGPTGAVISTSIEWACADGSTWEGLLLTSFEPENDDVNLASISLRIAQRRQVEK